MNPFSMMLPMEHCLFDVFAAKQRGAPAMQHPKSVSRISRKIFGALIRPTKR
jgi:hypothetical protein